MIAYVANYVGVSPCRRYLFIIDDFDVDTPRPPIPVLVMLVQYPQLTTLEYLVSMPITLHHTTVYSLHFY